MKLDFNTSLKEKILKDIENVDRNVASLGDVIHLVKKLFYLPMK